MDLANFGQNNEIDWVLAGIISAIILLILFVLIYIDIIKKKGEKKDADRTGTIQKVQ